MNRLVLPRLASSQQYRLVAEQVKSLCLSPLGKVCLFAGIHHLASVALPQACGLAIQSALTDPLTSIEFSEVTYLVSQQSRLRAAFFIESKSADKASVHYLLRNKLYPKLGIQTGIQRIVACTIRAPSDPRESLTLPVALGQVQWRVA